MDQMMQEAKVVVGLDFGTTFSGFAYALRADPENVYTFFDWPMQSEGGGLIYCKTQTSLLYVAGPKLSPELRGWGWPAYVKYKSMNSDPNSHLFTLFKLHLATKDASRVLPAGITVRRAISDYLSEISKFILEEVQNRFGAHICLEDVQWCLTVPAIWDEKAKEEMRHCSGMAGLNVHSLKLFVEPEAASIYCQMKLQAHDWRKGEKFLVVDCGGGTVDLVLHEKLGAPPSVSVREVQASSGDLCGGSHVDEEFISLLKRRITCFRRFEMQYPATALAFRHDWGKVKQDYAGDNEPVDVELPAKLAEMWEVEATHGNYDEIRISGEEMRSIFDPVVNRILELVEEKMLPDLQAILVVGGFSASPYLMRRMREKFGGRVTVIVSPPNPGSAVCCGAVTMGIRSDTVVSRISKKTYGIRVSTPFIYGVHHVNSMVTGDGGLLYSWTRFSRHVSKGDEVQFDECVKKEYKPVSKAQTTISIDLYSSDRENAVYTTDPGMWKEGTFTVACPSFHALGVWPWVEVAMFFGRSEIHVTAVGKNFDCGKKEMLPVKFDRNSIF